MNLSKRFWRHVAVKDANECWEWQASRMNSGYGQFNLRLGKVTTAHRVAWTLICGDIPNGLHVCHTCDNPLCCNPDHLYLGTPAENNADAGRKGHMARDVRGEKNPHSKLTTQDVLVIRSSELSNPALASIYGVTSSMIGQIRRRTSWKHV